MKKFLQNHKNTLLITLIIFAISGNLFLHTLGHSAAIGVIGAADGPTSVYVSFDNTYVVLTFNTICIIVIGYILFFSKPNRS